MGFKMKGSAFKLGNVATKSALKDKQKFTMDQQRAGEKRHGEEPGDHPHGGTRPKTKTNPDGTTTYSNEAGTWTSMTDFTPGDIIEDRTKEMESVPQMKSPLEQYREQMFGKGKREKRKKYMSNKEYDEKYEITPEKKKDGNVITRGLRNIGKAIGNIKIKAGGRGGYEMGPGGRGNWRG